MRRAETVEKGKRKREVLGRFADTRAGIGHEQLEELIPALIESSPIGFYIVQDRKFRFVNQQLSEITCFSREELLEKDPLSIVHPDDRAMVRENAVRMLKGERSTPYEFRVLAKNGDTKHIVETVISIRYDEKLATLGYWLDLTERKRQELEYKIIVQTTLDGFWLADMQGRFLDVNDAYCHLIGYSRDELLKMSITDIEAIEKSEETAARIAKIREVGGDRFETRHRCKDGRIIDVEVSVNYVEVGWQDGCIHTGHHRP